MSVRPVTVVGGGLAGSEAAWQLARRGVPVSLHEMRPVHATPVHRTDRLAELVCSNSFKSLELSNAHGLLKEELARLGSFVLRCAHLHRVPGGAALAVDREAFAAAVTRSLLAEPLVTVTREEVREIPPDGIVILAVGPLVSERIAAAIERFTGEGRLYFFDAIAPVVEAESIDRSIAFPASRYGKGGGEDYLNCPLSEDAYDRFLTQLLAGEKAALHEFDATPFFEGCLPIEEMARRGRATLRFGPMKPVGLVDPRTGRRPFAVLQLRQDDLAAEHYSMVGFQTQLKWAEQKRIFRGIPGLESAEFVRLGQIHRNAYVQAPRILRPTLQSRRRETLLFAGQISGVEGYSESVATGWLAGVNAARLASGQTPVVLPAGTMLGALMRYLTEADPEQFRPTNAALGLLPDPGPLEGPRRQRREHRVQLALAALSDWMASTGEGSGVRVAP